MKTAYLPLHIRNTAAVWKCCLEPRPDIHTPVEHGWITEEAGNLAVTWMIISPAPDDILKLVTCSYAKVCKIPKYSCLAVGMHCTDMCKLQECTNWRQATAITCEEEIDHGEVGPNWDDPQLLNIETKILLNIFSLFRGYYCQCDTLWLQTFPIPNVSVNDLIVIVNNFHRYFIHCSQFESLTFKWPSYILWQLLVQHCLMMM